MECQKRELYEEKTPEITGLYICQNNNNNKESSRMESTENGIMKVNIKLIFLIFNLI